MATQTFRPFSQKRIQRFLKTEKSKTARLIRRSEKNTVLAEKYRKFYLKHLHIVQKAEAETQVLLAERQYLFAKNAHERRLGEIKLHQAKAQFLEYSINNNETGPLVKFNVENVESEFSNDNQNNDDQLDWVEQQTHQPPKESDEPEQPQPVELEKNEEIEIEEDEPEQPQPEIEIEEEENIEEKALILLLSTAIKFYAASVPGTNRQQAEIQLQNAIRDDFIDTWGDDQKYGHLMTSLIIEFQGEVVDGVSKLNAIAIAEIGGHKPHLIFAKQYELKGEELTVTKQEVKNYKQNAAANKYKAKILPKNE